MKNVFKVILVILAILIVAFGLEFMGIEWTKFFAPRKEAIRREVFTQTRSYQEGKLQDLSKYMFEYNKTSSNDEKYAIAILIRQQFAEFNPMDIKDSGMRNFLNEIKSGRK